MIRKPAIAWLCSLIAASAGDLPDLLRFTNDDQLRGTFRGMREGPQVLWQNEDLAEPAAFRTNRIRHIVLRGGRPHKPLGTLSHAGLINGDQVPGSITALDAESITLETGHAGTLRIPRDRVALLAPNPLGGRVHYHGPFAEDDWKMVHSSFPDGLPEADPAVKDPKDGDTPGRWTFSGSAWYWQGKRAGTALVRESGMPERSVLRFDLAWKNRLNLAIAIHADFVRPPAEEGKEEQDGKAGANRGVGFLDANTLPRLFGNGYVLQLYSNYLTLIRTSLDATGKSSIERQHFNSGNMRLGETGRARIELRSNRGTGEIALFVNDEFTAQWSGIDMAADEPPDGFPRAPMVAAAGPGFGFVVQGGDSPVRISDIIISEWNGMPDSARSLQADDQDVVLMSNGTDRYAGRVDKLDEQGSVLFEGRHGRFRFPLDEVAEIRFARSRLATPVENPGETLRVRFSPIGSISGQPLTSNGTNLGLLSPVMGRVDLSMESAVMIDFNATTPPIDDWNADF